METASAQGNFEFLLAAATKAGLADNPGDRCRERRDYTARRMRVFLIRHSLAVASAPGLPDGHRYLSKEGRERARAVGSKLATEGTHFDRVLTSPLVRAVQTAELIVQHVSCEDILVLDALLPGVAPEAVVPRLGSASAVALVGHAPTISDIGALLTSQPSFLPLRPCQVAVVDGGRPLYTLNPETVEIEQLLLPR